MEGSGSRWAEPLLAARGASLAWGVLSPLTGAALSCRSRELRQCDEKRMLPHVVLAQHCTAVSQP